MGFSYINFNVNFRKIFGRQRYFLTSQGFRGFRGFRGFTSVEMCMVVFILGILLSIGVPSLLGMRDQNYRLKCLSNQRQIQSAKDAFVLDHLGEYYTNDSMPDDRKAVYRSYFVEGFTDQVFCPRTMVGYDGVYDIYYRTSCVTCGSDGMGSPP